MLKVLINVSNCTNSGYRVGRQVQECLEGCKMSVSGDLTVTDTPCSILFPASHGFGLTSTLLLQFLIDRHNTVLKMFAAEKKVQLTTASCLEILDSSMLVAVDAQVNILTN